MLNMHRRLAIILLMGFSIPILAQAQATGEGYELIDPPINTKTPDKVEVLEYFWFGCPHCYAFEPSINEWRKDKPKHVEFIREAPPLNPGWIVHSQAFYAAEILGVTDIFFDAMFTAIHKDKRRLRKSKEIAEFAGELGIDSEEFLDTMKSFGVDTRIKESLRMARASGITGVPAIVINGKYKTGNSIAGGHEGIINVINKMVEKEHN